MSIFATPSYGSSDFKLTAPDNIGKVFAVAHTGDRKVETAKYGDADVAVATVTELDLAGGVATEYDGVFIFPAYIRTAVRDAGGKPVLGRLARSEELGSMGTSAWILEPVSEAEAAQAEALVG